MPERHEKLAQALDLIVYLAASRAGRTMAELQAELGCGRRTVERLFAAIRQVGFEIEEVPTDEREKRWRMPPNELLGRLRMTAAELAEIEAAAARLVQEGVPARAKTLRDAANKLRAMLDAADLRRTEADVEALLAGEGLAARPGPRIEVPEGCIETLRHALLASRCVDLRYTDTKGEVREYVIEPCGLVYGTRAYLLGVRPGKPEAAMWRLDRIVSLELAKQSFVPRPGFDVTTLMRDCFGVWRESPKEVVLRFGPGAARDAAAWRFHGSQVLQQQDDGSLIVRFRAGGLVEMANHLATWGDTVEVLSPPELRRKLAELGAALVRAHGRASEEIV